MLNVYNEIKPNYYEIYPLEISFHCIREILLQKNLYYIWNSW